MKRNIKKLMTWAVVLAAPTLSRADVLFTNFGPGFTYNTSLGNPVGNAFDGNNYAEGDTFSLSTNAIFNSLNIALSCVFSGGCVDPITVSLTANGGNQPAAGAIESFSIPGPSLGLLGANNSPLVLTSVLHPFLNSGSRYWITISTDLNDSVSWNWNSTGDASIAALSTDGGSSWFSPSGFTPGAYQVNGQVVVPEPRLQVLSGGLLILLAVLITRKSTAFTSSAARRVVSRF